MVATRGQDHTMDDLEVQGAGDDFKVKMLFLENARRQFCTKDFDFMKTPSKGL